MDKDRIWTKDFVLLLVSLLLISCANYYFASSIAIYANLIGCTGALAGLITASFYVGSVGMRLVNGVLVQKYGPHKLMAVSAALCFCACFAHNYAGAAGMLLTLRLLHGAGYSIFTTASGTAASYLVPRGRLSEGMGYYTIGNVIAMAIGPSIALALITNNTIEEFRSLFYTAAAICFTALMLVMFLKDKDIETGDGEPEKKQVARTLPPTFCGFERAVFLPAFVSFLMTFSYSPVIVYLSIFALQRGWGGVGLAYTIYAAGLLSSRLFAGRLGDRMGADYVMIPSYLCGAAALALIGLSGSEWQMFFAMGCMGLCIGAYNPQINVLCITRCSKERRGTATAAFYGASDLGFAVGSAVTGFFIDHLGFVFTYLNGAAMCLVTMLLYIFLLSDISSGQRHNLHLGWHDNKKGA